MGTQMGTCPAWRAQSEASEIEDEAEQGNQAKLLNRDCPLGISSLVSLCSPSTL